MGRVCECVDDILKSSSITICILVAWRGGEGSGVYGQIRVDGRLFDFFVIIAFFSHKVGYAWSIGNNGILFQTPCGFCLFRNSDSISNQVWPLWYSVHSIHSSLQMAYAIRQISSFSTSHDAAWWQSTENAEISIDLTRSCVENDQLRWIVTKGLIIWFFFRSCEGRPVPERWTVTQLERSRLYSRKLERQWQAKWRTLRRFRKNSRF